MLSDIYLSRTSGLNREQRPRKTKNGTDVPHVTCDLNTFKVKRSRSLWLAVLAGQHGHRVSNASRCVYDVYCVATCRPGWEHIVAASRLQLVIFSFNMSKPSQPTRYQIATHRKTSGTAGVRSFLQTGCLSSCQPATTSSNQQHKNTEGKKCTLWLCRR